jgi:acyl-CoA synthetase (AMP-forming)/AMP-acid ligase II
MSIFSVPAMLDNISNQFPDKVALVHDSISLTFKELHHQALATSNVLRHIGIKKGDRIGICMNKSIDQVIVILGSLYANAIFVPVLPRLKRDNIAHIISDSGMRFMISESTRLAEVEEFSAEVNILIGNGIEDGKYLDLLSLRGNLKDSINFFSSISEDPAGIIYSSGSTGRPKGIVTSHRNFYDGARIVSSYLGTQHDDRIAGILSFNFDYGLNQIWQCLYKGSTLYLHDLLLPSDFFSFVEKSKITALPLMPVIISRIFDPRFSNSSKIPKLESVRYVCSSGGRVSPVMIDYLKKTFVNAEIFLMYGLTEAFRSTFLPPEQLDIRPGSIGRAIPETEIYVLDENNEDCPPGVPGELVHRGGCISKGYWNDEEKTAFRFKTISKFPGERVVFSGDLVKKDEDGYIYFISRKDNMLKNSGIRISPTEVEETIEKNKRILASVVFGVENIEVGHDLVLVYRTADKEPIPQVELISFLKKELPSHMVPKFQIHMSDFPVLGNDGKIDRVAVIAIASRLLKLEKE